MKMPVLLVCGDATLRLSVRRVLTAAGWMAAECTDRSQSALRLSGVRVLVFASTTAEESRKDLNAVRECRRAFARMPIVLVACESSEDLAVAALRSGVDDFLRYTQVAEELAPAIARFVAFDTVPAEMPGDSMVGVSRSLLQLKSYLARIAATDSNVLITGETGTGKELAAEMVHRASLRRARPLVPVNCAAIPETLVESELFGHERGAFTGAHASREGKFQLADGGTVFLDEIGDMDLGSQAKLLRAIETKEVHSLGSTSGMRINVRIVAATNQDPEQLVREKRFRNDLYFRLNVARVHLAPLRDHKEDIRVLVRHTITELNRRFGYQVEDCSPEAWTLLHRYDWPGNVRELKNLLEATFIGLSSSTISPGDFPEAFHRRLEVLDGAEGGERERLVATLSATNWNKSKAAEALHWSRMTLYRKIAKYHLSSR